MASQIVPSSKQIGDCAAFVHRHGIDRKIAAGQIVRETAHKAHSVGVAAIVICTVEPVGRDLGADAI